MKPAQPTAKPFAIRFAMLALLWAVTQSEALTIDSLSPTSGPAGTEVTIRGSGFLNEQGDGTAAIGGTGLAKYVTWSDTVIVGSVRDHALGTADLVVVNSAGETDTLTGAFTYRARPRSSLHFGYGFGF